VLLPDITNPFYAALVSGIQERALETGHTMLLCTTEGDPEQGCTGLPAQSRSTEYSSTGSSCHPRRSPDSSAMDCRRLSRPRYRLDAGAAGRSTTTSGHGSPPSTCSGSATSASRTSQAHPTCGSAGPNRGLLRPHRRAGVPVGAALLAVGSFTEQGGRRGTVAHRVAGVHGGVRGERSVGARRAERSPVRAAGARGHLDRRFRRPAPGDSRRHR
jgi:hypothetical protein